MAATDIDIGADTDPQESRKHIREETREQWARRMRLRLTTIEMMDEEGNLDLEYFKPKLDGKSARSWGPEESRKLCEGIAHHGACNWRQISEDFLPEWEPKEIRIKGIRAIGRQSLAEYKGWKGPEKAILQERQRNEEFAKDHGLWKGGVLVAPDGGEIQLPKPIIWTKHEDGTWTPAPE